VAAPQSRSQHRHGVGEAALMGHDAVGVALHHQGRAGLAHGVPRHVQPIQQIALGEQRRFRRVDVLGWAGRAGLGQDAPPQSHRASLHVADREQQPAAEPVIGVSTPGRGDHQPDCLQGPQAETRRSGPTLNPVPSIGGESETELRNAGGRDAPFGQVLSGGLGLGILKQALVVLALGPGRRLVELPFVGRSASSAVRRFPSPPQPDSGPIGEDRQGLGEGNPVHLHHEAEHVPPDVADPALERLALGIDLEAGSGVVVPGAQPHVVAALAPQLHVLSHQFDDVGRLSDQLFRLERGTERHRQLLCGKMRKVHFTSQNTGRQIPLPGHVP